MLSKNLKEKMNRKKILIQKSTNRMKLKLIPKNKISQLMKMLLNYWKSKNQMYSNKKIIKMIIYLLKNNRKSIIKTNKQFKLISKKIHLKAPTSLKIRHI